MDNDKTNEKAIDKNSNLSSDKKDLSLEDTFQEIEDVIKKMEDKELSLDASFKLFKNGTDLIRKCNDKIDKVEKEVQIIKESGELSDFTVKEE